MDAVTDKNLEAPIIQRYWNVDSDFLIRIAHKAIDALFESELPGGDFEARFRRSVDIHFIVRRQGRRRHNLFSAGLRSAVPGSETANFTSGFKAPMDSIHS